MRTVVGSLAVSRAVVGSPAVSTTRLGERTGTGAEERRVEVVGVGLSVTLNIDGQMETVDVPLPANISLPARS